MKTLRLALIFSTALLLRNAPAQTPATTSSDRPAPDLATQRRPPKDARITYRQGQLQVIADDSSLNLTLLQIARLTGLKVSGVAVEERIFGTYGPSAPAGLIRILLQGTGTNMLLTQSSANGPAQLVLTPQNGPVTPPKVHAATLGQPPFSVASAPLQSAPGANTSPANQGTGQAEPDSNVAEPLLAPRPLTAGERALLVDRLQQQQREAARLP